MTLPPMCPAYGRHHHYLTPPSLRQCWIDKCPKVVDPNDDLGLCDDHVEEFRSLEDPLGEPSALTDRVA